MHEWMVIVRRGKGHGARRVKLFVQAVRRGMAIQCARQSFYCVGKGQIVDVRRVTA